MGVLEIVLGRRPSSYVDAGADTGHGIHSERSWTTALNKAGEKYSSAVGKIVEADTKKVGFCDDIRLSGPRADVLYRVVALIVNTDHHLSDNEFVIVNF